MAIIEKDLKMVFVHDAIKRLIDENCEAYAIDILQKVLDAKNYGLIVVTDKRKILDPRIDEADSYAAATTVYPKLVKEMQEGERKTLDYFNEPSSIDYILKQTEKPKKVKRGRKNDRKMGADN